MNRMSRCSTTSFVSPGGQKALTEKNIAKNVPKQDSRPKRRSGKRIA
jgi:hypothetical protein